MMFGGFLLFVGISWCKLKSATNSTCIKWYYAVKSN